MNGKSTTTTNGDSGGGVASAASKNVGKIDKSEKTIKMGRGGRLLVMLLMTFFFFVVEIVFGYVSHSMALIADSFHMLSDVMALAIAYGCLKVAQRSTTKNTFGWVRAEVLGALINGVFLLALCFSIFIESINRFLSPEMIKEPRNVLIVGVIGFIINLIGMMMFHAHSHSHVPRVPNLASKETIEGAETKHLINCHQDAAMALADLEAAEESLMTENKIPKNNHYSTSEQLNMHGVFLHVLSDAIGSVIVIATALVSWLLPGFVWLKLYMDPFLSIILVLLMVCTTFPLVRETALILLQTTPKFIDLERIKMDLVKIDGIVAVHDFHVWRLVGERIIATVHIRFVSLKHYLMAAEQIRALFHDNHIHSATIQPEFSEMESTAGPDMECAFACLPSNCAVSDSGVKCCKEAVLTKRSPPSQQSSSSLLIDAVASEVNATLSAVASHVSHQQPDRGEAVEKPSDDSLLIHERTSNDTENYSTITSSPEAR